MLETNFLFELTLIVAIATALALIGRGIKQPPIIAYLITGVIAGPLVLGILGSQELIEIFSSLGITFLLFVVGLSLDFRVFKNLTKNSILIGVLQAALTATASFFIALSLNFSPLHSLYIALALAFSSTVVVVNILAEKRELETLHGKISLGILIVQDFLAAAALIFLSLVHFNSSNLVMPFEELLKGGAAIGAVFILSYLIVPKILSSAAKNQELLFLFSLCWALIISTIFAYLGFSVAIGALIAGITLASSDFSFQISSKIKGFREFLVIIHLIFFGSLLSILSSKIVVAAIIFSLIVLIGNPLIILVSMKLFGYKKRPSFLTGIGIAQISELSLILVFLGFTFGLVSKEILSLIILVAIITIAVSTYALFYSDKIYSIFSSEKTNKKDPIQGKKQRFDVVLFGYNRIGFNLLKSFEKTNKKVLVIDYNPETIKDLKNKNIECIYGDASDPELLKELRLGHAGMVISTIPVLETNLSILENIKNKSTIFIPTSHEISTTEKLYRRGANYVIMPHFLGGNFVADLLAKENFSSYLLEKETQKLLRELKERSIKGHDHPTKDWHGI